MPEAPKLYHTPASPNSRRVRILLSEKGISLPLVSIAAVLPAELCGQQAHHAAHHGVPDKCGAL
jgi:hypothetical protein